MPVLSSCAASGDREALTGMILASMVESDPEGCLKYGTQHFLERTTGREGKAAVVACEEDALEPQSEQPSDVDVSEIDLDDDSATAVIAFQGSLFDGQRVRYAFVERNGQWKYDEMMEFVDLDSEHLILQLGREGLLRAESRQEEENIVCWIGQMERMSDQMLEELLFRERSVSSNCTTDSSAI